MAWRQLQGVCMIIINMTANVGTVVKGYGHCCHGNYRAHIPDVTATGSYLQLQDPLLNAASNDKACHMDRLVLTQPVDAVLCLLLHSWIPPVTAQGQV